MTTRRTAVVALVGLALSACTGSGSDGPGGRELLVSAAASLSDAFGEIAAAFEQANPGLDVVLNLGGSSALREQIIEGAPVDVFASAGRAVMDEVVAAGRVESDPVVFATNSLRIAVPAGNPAGVTGLSDFSDPDLVIGLCAEGVPCGDLARQSLSAAGIVAAVDTNEPDVRALLTKIEAGELDAGITYATDVASAGSAVDGIELPAEVNVTAAYPIAVIAGASDLDEAEEFVAFVLSTEGREILTRYGFGSP